ncbi:hypothetical protein CYMTET_15891, partial [Cymbomonas tetramitiformis]
VWLKLSGADALRAQHGALYYEDLEQSMATQADKEALHQIDKDIHRTGGRNQTILQQLDGRSKLARVLMRFSVHNPLIGYCQGMNFIAHRILAHVEGAEEPAFWLLVALTQRERISGYFVPSMEALVADLALLEEYVLPSELGTLAAHLVAVEFPVACFAQHLLCLFTESFPPNTVSRLLDIVICDEDHVLLHVLISLLRRSQLFLENLSDIADIQISLMEAAHNLYDADDFINEVIGERKRWSLTAMELFDEMLVVSQLMNPAVMD